MYANFFKVHGFFSDLPFLLIASCILYFLVEAPTMVLLRYLLKNERPGKQQTFRTCERLNKTNNAKREQLFVNGDICSAQRL
jgi:hypothetical protein